MVHIKHSTRCLAHGSVYTIIYVCGSNYHYYATHSTLIFILSSLVKDQPEESEDAGKDGRTWENTSTSCQSRQAPPQNFLGWREGVGREGIPDPTHPLGSFSGSGGSHHSEPS